MKGKYSKLTFNECEGHRNFLVEITLQQQFGSWTNLKLLSGRAQKYHERARKIR